MVPLPGVPSRGVVTTFEELYPKRERAVQIVQSCRTRLAIVADEVQVGDAEKMLDTMLRYGDYDTAAIPFRNIINGRAAAAATAATRGGRC